MGFLLYKNTCKNLTVFLIGLSWVSEFELAKLGGSKHFRAHSTSAQATFAACLKNAPISATCSSVIWNSAHMFTRNTYSLVEASRLYACFGRAILHMLFK